MQVVLLERIERLGSLGDVVTVRPGFARNFLLPRGKALRATKENISHFEAQRAHYEAENLKKKGSAEEKADMLSKLKLSVIRKASDAGHLYGSVTSRDIAQLLTKDYCPVEKGQIIIDKPIKEVGVHKVRVALHPEICPFLLVSVAQTEEEALQLFEDFENSSKKKENLKQDTKADSSASEAAKKAKDASTDAPESEAPSSVTADEKEA